MVSLPGNPTVMKLSMNVGGANELDIALFAQLDVPKKPIPLLMELVYDDADT